MQARRLYHSENLSEAHAVIEPEAAGARNGGSLAPAIELTLWESLILKGLGQTQLALARATWCISAALAPSNQEALRGEAWGVAMSFMIFVDHAQVDDRIPFDKLLEVLDAAERFVEGAGRPHWRAGVLSERASVLRRIGRVDDAVETLQEAHAMKVQWPDSPGHTADTMRRSLGSALARAGRRQEAATIFDAIMADPTIGALDRLAAAAYGARNALEGGDPVRAAALSDEACRMCDPLGASQVMAAHGVAVEAYVAVGRLDDAKRSAARVLQQAEVIGTSGARYNAHEDAARVAMATGDANEFSKHMDALQPLAEAHDRRAGFADHAPRIEALREDWANKWGLP